MVSDTPNASIEAVTIEGCSIKNVPHTGIKLTGQSKNIRHICISGNEIRETGAPGIQMSGVSDAYVGHNAVRRSGSSDDGPADLASAHIDFNCDNIVLQYNLSAYNAGGYYKVLGNTYNCAYRYNVSINDGHRHKGVGSAFQEGKTLWLSGYQGQTKNRKGLVNFYFYNNTIYCVSSLVAKIAIDNTSNGVLITNNIFCLKGGARSVLGDKYKPDTKNSAQARNVVF